jgi:hypothetical protein
MTVMVLAELQMREYGILILKEQMIAAMVVGELQTIEVGVMKEDIV